jgi:hypothetical protein
MNMKSRERNAGYTLMRATMGICLTTILGLPLAATGADAPGFREVADGVGLGVLSGGRTRTADIDGDGRSDLMLFPTSRKEAIAPLLWRNVADPESPAGFRFEPIEDSGLPRMMFGDIVVFADLDNDGIKDAIITRYLDYLQDNYVEPIDAPARTGWMRGDGTGRFLDPQPLAAALPATTAAIAVGDVNLDGLPDLWIGNWYEKYFTGVEAFSNDLLLQHGSNEGIGFVRWPIPGETRPTDYLEDGRGRPPTGP